jgi:hypothetical protein
MIKGDVVSKIMAFEEGEMEEVELVEFFQEIIDSGLVWQLQGFYGRTAMDLINNGLCVRR